MGNLGNPIVLAMELAPDDGHWGCGSVNGAGGGNCTVYSYLIAIGTRVSEPSYDAIALQISDLGVRKSQHAAVDFLVVLA